MFGVGEIIITQADSTSLTVEADDNFQPLILSEVRNGTLFLSMKPNVNLGRFTRMTFHVIVKDLTQLTLSGAAMINASNLSSDTLTVNHSGAGSVTIAGTVNEQIATLMRADSIAYIGRPELHEQVSGLGSIQQRAS